MKSWKLYLLILLLSCPPLIHIFLNSGLPHTSDGLMHVARSAAYLKELDAGQFPVRWAHQFNYGYGTPIFNFFNPLPYITGALLLAIGFNLAMVLKIGFVATYLLGGIFMYLFAKAYFKDTRIALILTFMYQYAPFRLVEMHTRGDIGCLYSYMTLPLVFYAITKFIEKNTYPRLALLSISVALLPLGHNINGFVFFGLSALYVPFATQNLRKIITTYLAMGFGLLLTAYFIFPALFELKYLNGYIFSKHLFYMHFPEWYKLILPNILNSPSLRVAEVSVQIGFFHVIATIGMVYLLATHKIAANKKNLAIYLTIITSLTLLLMQPITKPLWENFHYLRQFQFPWRFLSVLIFTTSVAAGFVIPKNLLKNTKIFIVLLILIITSTFFYWWPYQGYQDIDEKHYRNYPGSTNYFAEVNTIWMAHEPMQFPKNRIEVIGGNAKLSNIKIRPEQYSFNASSTNDSQILVNNFFYPGWRARVDEKPSPIEFQDGNHRGLITFRLPKGDHEVVVEYQENRISKISNVITLLSVFLLIVGFIVHFYKKRHHGKKSS